MLDPGYGERPGEKDRSGWHTDRPKHCWDGKYVSDRAFPFFIVLLVLLGTCIGWLLAIRPSFSVPAVLNVVGIGYSILAVIVLYEAIAENEEFKRVIVTIVAPTLLWAQTVVPLGVTASWFLIRNLHHGNEISALGFSFFMYSILPLLFLDATVTFPRFAKLTPIDGRHRRFGLFLLLSGLAMQLVAGVAGLRVCCPTIHLESTLPRRCLSGEPDSFAIAQ